MSLLILEISVYLVVFLEIQRFLSACCGIDNSENTNFSLSLSSAECHSAMNQHEVGGIKLFHLFKQFFVINFRNCLRKGLKLSH